MVRYRPSNKRDPREDSLTQAFLATLLVAEETQSGLVKALVEGWCGRDIKSLEVKRIQAQRKVRETRERIDLALELENEDWTVADFAVWVEVKHGADLSGKEQLHNYLAALAREYPDTESRLVFLPPLGFGPLPEKDKSAHLEESNWQDTSVLIAKWLDDNDLKPKVDWVARQFLQFLEEEGLYVRQSLDENTWHQLERAESSVNSLNFLLRQVRDWLINFAESTSHMKADFSHETSVKWPGFYVKFSVKGVAGVSNEDVWFEWCLRPKGIDHEQPEFGAGLTFSKQFNCDAFSDFHGHEIPDSTDALVFDEEDGYSRLFWWKPIAEAIEGKESLSEQAKQVAVLVGAVLSETSNILVNADHP